jgi:hypothetical protein
MSQAGSNGSGGGGGGGIINDIDLDSGSITGATVKLSGGTTGLTTTAVSATEGDLTGTLIVANGGTGKTTFTAYSVVCAGTTATGVFQNVVGVGSSGQILTSNGAAALPTWQNVSASGAITTITGNSGGAESPLAGNFNVLGTGSITVAGSANTETVQLTGLTNHNVLVGAGSPTITNVAPSATAGIPLVSNGAASDPSFTTAVVAGGGTGSTSFTAYTVICGGTTSTNSLQNVASVGTSGQVLTSNGAASLPSFQDPDPSLGVYFMANLGSNLTNVTGDGTSVNPVIFDTTVKNVGGGYDFTTGIFTAPVSGLYHFSFNLLVSGIIASHTDMITRLVSSTANNAIYNFVNPFPIYNVPEGAITASGSGSILMTALDTISLTFFVSNGPKQVSILADYSCQFTGFLLGA